MHVVRFVKEFITKIFKNFAANMSFLKVLTIVLWACISILCAEGAGSANLPPDIALCKAGDTNCIISSATAVVQRYGKTGYPKANFPIIEPFALKSIDISDGRQGSLSLKLNFRDVKVYGLSAVQLERVVGFERDALNSKFELHGYFPKISVRAKYIADGRILILPIRGDGDADIVLLRPKFSVKFKPSVQKRDGKTYMSVDKLKVLITPEKMQISLTNLFNGDKALGEHLNQFLNENWNDVWTELQPSIHAAVGEVAKSVISALFSKFAYEEIYLEN